MSPAAERVSCVYMVKHAPSHMPQDQRVSPRGRGVQTGARGIPGGLHCRVPRSLIFNMPVVDSWKGVRYTLFCKSITLLSILRGGGFAMNHSKAMQSKVSSKGWVVIPAALRRRYGLKPGAMIEFREEDEKIVLVPIVADPVEATFGMLAGRISLPKALLEDRARELKREETDLRAG